MSANLPVVTKNHLIFIWLSLRKISCSFEDDFNKTRKNFFMAGMTTTNQTFTKKSSFRRYELDWLRVLVFGLLIIHHVAMFFAPYAYYIKNDIIYPIIMLPMYFIQQWRLPILFLISGMGTFYSLSNRSKKAFAKERVIRLFLPLMIGILFIIPPQVYFERLDRDQFTGSYFDFWPSQAFIGIYPEGNISWHHL